MKERSLDDRAFVAPGIVAGLIAGVLLEAYLLVTVVGIERVPLVQFFQFTASGALGRAAFADPSTAWLGVAIHLGVSVMWGIGYAFAARTTPQLISRPITSGAAYGFVVLLAMQLVEVGANIFRIPRDNFELFNLFISHMVFFGIPLAYVVASRMRAARRA